MLRTSFLRALPDLPVLVRVDERADALVREHLGQQPFVDLPVDHVHARHAAWQAAHRVARLRHLRRRHGALLQRSASSSTASWRATTPFNRGPSAVVK
jgi:hypothetical protein